MSYAKNNFFYKRFTVGIASYPAISQITFNELGFTPTRLIISRVRSRLDLSGSPGLDIPGVDSPTINFSFNGDDLHGEIFPTDDTLVLDELTWNKLFFKLDKITENVDIRVWAWRR